MAIDIFLYETNPKLIKYLETLKLIKRFIHRKVKKWYQNTNIG